MPRGKKPAFIPLERLEEARRAYEDQGPNKTANLFGMSSSTFRRVAREHGWVSKREVIESKQSSYTQAQIDQIILEKYPLLGSRLTELIPFSAEKIRLDAVRLGVESEKGKKMALNQGSLKTDYFKTWSPIMSYDLGYIWADGASQYKSNTLTPATLHLKCSREDEQIILDLRDRLGSNHTITRGSEVHPDTGNISHYTRTAISSKDLVDSLITLHGVLPGKSKLDLSYSIISDEFFSYFLRGYFDGDGTTGEYFYTYRKNAKYMFTLQGSQ